MYLSPDEARSDVILAAAPAVVGMFVVRLVTQLPLYPRGGVLGIAVGLFWLFALTGLVPLLLSRYRGDRVAAFGLDGPRDGWRRGVALAVPVAVLSAVSELVATGSLVPTLLGRLGGATGGSPALTATGLPGPLEMVVGTVEFVALTTGALLLTTFLTIRGRDGLRPVDISLTQALRTVGMGAVGVALITGLLRSFGPDVRVLPMLLQVIALAALVLVADRLVPLGPTVARGAVIAPVVVVVVAHVFTIGGGLLFGNPLVGLHTGALAGGTAVVVAVMVAGRRMAWAVVPLMIALHWWPSCLSPVPLDRAAGGC